MLNTFYLNRRTQGSLSSIGLREEDLKNFDQYYKQDNMISYVWSHIIGFHVQT